MQCMKKHKTVSLQNYDDFQTAWRRIQKGKKKMSRIQINIENCTGKEYILFPACAYKGNQFDVLPKEYPPLLEPEEMGVNLNTIITDVPRLNKDGSGRIEVTTGDVSVPCVGIFVQAEKKAVFVFTIQQIKGRNIGLAYEKGCVTLTWPAYREMIYRWPHMVKNDEKYVDEEAEIPFQKLEVPCKSIAEFYEIFFRNRKLMKLNDELPDEPSWEELRQIQLEKHNSMNWFEEGQFYGSTTTGSEGNAWETGWVGGGISSYALMKLGGKTEYERSIKTLAHLFRLQGESGIFYSGSNAKGEVIKEKKYEETDGLREFSSVRDSGDALYFLFQHFALMKEVPESMRKGTKGCADAFVKLWNTYGQLGQFVNAVTGEILVGGSAAGGIVPAGLVSAYEYFGDRKYLDAAEEIAAFFYHNFVERGYTTGGPNEILQCPDSESAFALLESYTELYRVTLKPEWLSYAKTAAHLCSSWVAAYNYEFPPASEFNRLEMKTIGTVFANVQNKHSAPGICTLSGGSLKKLYDWTKEECYRRLYEEITITISQYMSTDKRPIYSWDVPKDATSKGLNHVTVPREKLPAGFICERVNMSDWETDRCVGGVFNGSCWSEVSNLLVLTERLAR